MAGVLSSGVEYSSIDARPLVRVYSRRQLRRMMSDAGFADVEIRVRHFRSTDTIPTRALAKVAPPLGDPKRLDRLGRLAGWYVIAVGTR
jgi:hypothetical protein